ncbi:MAG: ABC transporter substrate-binding protein [Candidatus Geothermarchaeales archaeon]
MRKALCGILAILVLLTLQVSTALADPQRYEWTGWEPYGPHINDLYFIVVKSPDAQLIALQTGEADGVADLIRPDDVETLSADPKFQMTFAPQFHYVYVGFNMRVSPTDDDALRKAISHLIPREEIASELFRGTVTPVYSVVPPSSMWYNPDVPKYAYNPEAAAALLDEAGYTVDKATGKRIDPTTGKPLRDIKIMTPTAEVAPTTAQIGTWIAEEGQRIGLPLVAEPTDFDVIVNKVMNEHDYDAYILAWGLSREPTYLYDFFHSDFDVPGGYNTPGIRDDELDALLEEIWFGFDFEKKEKAAMEAQAMLGELLPYAPIYSRTAINAFSSELSGVVNLLGFGSADPRSGTGWTFLNAHWKDEPFGGTFRFILSEEVSTLNVLLSTASESQNMMIYGRIFEGLIAINPEDNSDMPRLATEWSVEPWTTPEGLNGTRVMYTLRDDVLWQDGVPFTSEDIKFAMEYIAKNRVPLYTSMWQNLIGVEAPDPTHVIAYFNESSPWFLYEVPGSALPKHIWEDVEDWEHFAPWEEPHPFAPGLTKLIGTGPYVLRDFKFAEYVHLQANPLYWAQGFVMELVTGAGTAIRGDVRSVTARLIDYTGRGVEDAVVSVTATPVKGGNPVTVSAAHIGGGLYDAKIDTEETGDGEFTVDVEARWRLGTRKESFKLTVLSFDEIEKALTAIGESLTSMERDLTAKVNTLTTDVGSLTDQVNALSREVEGLRGYINLLGGVAVTLALISIALGFALRRRRA